MAKVIKTATQRATADELRMVPKTHKRNDFQGALAAAARSASEYNVPRYVYATQAGYSIVEAEPVLPSGWWYWKVVVTETEIKGVLFEC